MARFRHRNLPTLLPRGVLSGGLVGLLLLVTACGASYPRPAAPGDTVAASAAATISVAIPEAPSNFNPLTPAGNTEVTREVMSLVWPSAFFIGPSFAPQVNFDFLSSAELVSVSPQTVVYKINPKATWSDGIAISASDFIYDWHAQSGDPQFKDVGGEAFQPVSTLGYSDIQSVVGSNRGKTVTVVFKQPFSDWESLFDPVVPSHLASSQGWNRGFEGFSSSLKVSGGPFEISSVGAGGVDLTPNPRWWGPPPELAGIDLVVTPVSSMASDLASGRVDVIEQSAQVDAAQKVSYLDSKDLMLLPGLNFEELEFNLKNPLLARLAVREAIAEYTDRSVLIAAGPGQLAPFQGFTLPPVDDNHIFVPATSGGAQSGYYTPNGSQFDVPRPSEASKLLESDGFAMGSDGFWHLGSPGGPVVALRYSTDESDPIKLAVAQTFQAQMRSAGIQVNLVNASSSELEGDLISGNFDIAEVTRTATPFPSELLDYYAAAPTPGSATEAPASWPLDHMPDRNLFGYESGAVNQLFAKAIANPDPYDAANYYNQIDDKLWSDMVSLPLYEDSELVAYSNRINGIASGGLPDVAPGMLLWNADQWSLRASSPATSSLPTSSTTTGRGK